MYQTETVLSMKSVTKTYGAVTALSNVSLDLKPGEILGLCGENGAGKSTLMKCLSGSIGHSDFDGEIFLNGNPTRFSSPLDAERAGVEMIYQEVSLHLDLSIAENVFLGRLPRKAMGRVDWRNVYEQAAQAMETVGLDVDVRETVRGLSTSKQQMIAIARSIIRNPKVLVLDEPTSALTDTEAATLFRILRTLQARGVACIYISHKMDEVFDLCDRITVIRDGAYISTSDVNASSPEAVIDDMVGRPLDRLYTHESVPSSVECFRIENIDVPHPTKPDTLLLSDISFNLKRGEILGLFGLVGAGRSELMSAVFDGSYKRNGSRRGRVFVQGDEVDIAGPADSINHRIAMLTEDRKVSGFVGTLNIARNISLAALRRVSGGGIIDSRQEMRMAEGISDRLSLKAAGMTASVLSLSGGNQQKVVLAKWLSAEPEILILDEPTRGIDVGAKAEIYRLMSELAASGKGIILISSELPELLAMSDRILALGNGEICQEFTRAEASQEALLQATSMSLATAVHAH